MGQLVGCIRGIGAACAALDMPIVSGNVSLYNETDGRAILPTPTIGAVGLLASLDELIRMVPRDGDVLLLLGGTRGHLGQSALLAELWGREEGDAPPVDLAAERAAGEFLRAAKAEGLVAAAHDLADGGLALAAAEMALAGGRRGRGLRRRRARRDGLVLRRGPGALPDRLPGGGRRPAAGAGGRGGGAAAGRRGRRAAPRCGWGPRRWASRRSGRRTRGRCRGCSTEAALPRRVAGL